MTAISKGTAIITVITKEGEYTASCTVNVTENSSENKDNTNSSNNSNGSENTDNTNSSNNSNSSGNSDNSAISVTKVTLSKAELKLNKGKSETITAVITPTNATNKNVTWSSSNETVARVSSTGKITAISEGTATITVRTSDGNYTDTCKVTVVSGDDDIYIENKSSNNNSSSINNNSSSDTSSNSSKSINANSSFSSIKSLPYTGAKTFIIIIAFAFALSAVVSYIKYKNINK